MQGSTRLAAESWYQTGNRPAASMPGDVAPAAEALGTPTVTRPTALSSRTSTVPSTVLLRGERADGRRTPGTGSCMAGLFLRVRHLGGAASTHPSSPPPEVDRAARRLGAGAKVGTRSGENLSSSGRPRRGVVVDDTATAASSVGHAPRP